MKPGGFQSSLFSLALACLVAACASDRETYAVLPDGQGQGGSVVVTPKAGKALRLDGAYASAVAVRDSSPERASLSPQELQSLFAEALAARPGAPLRFTLYFREGSDELTAESKGDLQRVMAAVRARAAPDVIVIGHTDRVGLLQDNDRLALRRAERMCNELLSQGLPADSVQAAGRGEREPLVPTTDEVPEPRNRRVEMLVR